jgi:hypothetical protein
MARWLVYENHSRIARLVWQNIFQLRKHPGAKAFYNLFIINMLKKMKLYFLFYKLNVAYGNYLEKN